MAKANGQVKSMVQERVGVKPILSQAGISSNFTFDEIKILDFSLSLVENEGDVYTPVYRLYENMSLEKSSYSKKIKKLKERGIDFKYLPVPTAKSGHQKTLCINIFDIPALLYLITVERLKPELRERVRQVQVETTKAIRNYWKLKVFSEREEIEKLKAEYN